MKRIYLLLALPIWFLACTAEETPLMTPAGFEVSLTPSLEAIITDASNIDVSEGINSYINIQAFSTLAVHDEDRWSASFESVFYDANIATDIASIKVSSFEFTKDPSVNSVIRGSLPQGGTTVDGQLLPMIVSRLDESALYAGAIYNPKYLQVSSPVYTPGQKIFISNADNSIDWIPDTDNELGLAVVIKYRPTHGQNQALAVQGYDERLTKIRVVPDNGQFTYEAQDFQGIPVGAYVDVFLIRANFEVIQGSLNGGNCLFSVSSKVVFGATYQEALD